MKASSLLLCTQEEVETTLSIALIANVLGVGSILDNVIYILYNNPESKVCCL